MNGKRCSRYGSLAGRAASRQFKTFQPFQSFKTFKAPGTANGCNSKGSLNLRMGVVYKGSRRGRLRTNLRHRG
jgi:hypothetical protein